MSADGLSPGMLMKTSFTTIEIEVARAIWRDLPDDVKDSFDSLDFGMMNELLEEAERRERKKELSTLTEVYKKEGREVMQWGPAYHMDDWVMRKFPSGGK
jgi:Mg/Co/Ni transporter MgtE